jgi:hypothetical protein
MLAVSARPSLQEIKQLGDGAARGRERLRKLAPVVLHYQSFS